MHACGPEQRRTTRLAGEIYYGQSAPPERDLHQVGAGGNIPAGIKSDGSLACWVTMVKVNRAAWRTFVQVSAGSYHTCGLRSDGSLACWGDNYYGQSRRRPGIFTQGQHGHEQPAGSRAVEPWPVGIQ